MSTPTDPYAKIQAMGASGRTLEGRAFVHAAMMLEEARVSASGDGRGDRRLSIKALRHNHQLWTIVQAALMEPDNTLPEDLKSDLLKLAAFVDLRTSEAIASSDPTLLQALIDINRDIAQGQLAAR